MMKGEAAADPDDYVARLGGWQRDLIVSLRAAILSAGGFDETIKWTNLVFLANGPCVLIRAEEHRVLLGFWHGKRLVPLDHRIKPSGKYELGNITLKADDEIDAEAVRALAIAARDLNREVGDPTKIAR